MFLFSRRYLLPWLISAIVMFGLSYLWHGLLLRDLQELKVPLGLYLGLSGLVYLVVGLVITVLVHEAIRHEWISLKRAFPLNSMLVGAVVGFVVVVAIELVSTRVLAHEHAAAEPTPDPA